MVNFQCLSARDIEISGENKNTDLLNIKKSADVSIKTSKKKLRSRKTTKMRIKGNDNS